MYKIEFYEKDGESQIFEFLEDLRKRKDTNKDARIQYAQATSYIRSFQITGPEGFQKALQSI